VLAVAVGALLLGVWWHSLAADAAVHHSATPAKHATKDKKSKGKNVGGKGSKGKSSKGKKSTGKGHKNKKKPVVKPKPKPKPKKKPAAGSGGQQQQAQPVTPVIPAVAGTPLTPPVAAGPPTPPVANVPPVGPATPPDVSAGNPTPSGSTSDPTVNVGEEPTGVAVSATRAYVDNGESNSVSVIDLTQNPPAVVGSPITVGAFPEGIALSPDGSEVYVTNLNGGTVSIISTATDTVTATVPVGKDPAGVVQIGGTIYVANGLSATISEIDAATDAVTGSISLPNNAAPSGLSASADSSVPGGTRLYVDDARNGRTFAFDDLTENPPTSLGSVAVGPYAAYLSTPTNPGFVAVPGDNKISLLDLSASPPTVEDSVTVGKEPYGVIDLPALNEALATNSGDDTVSIINTLADPPVAVGTVPVGGTPDGIAVTPDDTTAVVTNEGDNSVSILHLNQPPSVSLPANASVAANDSSSVHNQLVFSSANDNAISASDPDAGTSTVQATLTALDGTVTLSSTAGLTITGGTNGSSTVTVQGDLADLNSALGTGVTYEPNTSFQGDDSLSVSVDDLGNTGVGTAQTTTKSVTIDVTDAAPNAGDVSFSGAVGNTTFGVGTSPAAPSTQVSGPTATVLANSTDPNGDSIHAVADNNIGTTQHGSVSLNADGTFTNTPPAGFAGDDSFSFQVTDGTLTSTATATIEVAGLVWYVNNADATNGNGTSGSPFNTLASLPAVTTSGDDIFLFGSTSPYTGGLALKTNETLIGQSFGLVVGGQTLLPASGSNPTVTNSGGAGITVQSGDIVEGITVSGASGAGVTGSGPFTLDSSVKIQNGSADGLDVTGGTGTTAAAATISGNSGHSVSVQSNSGAVNVSGPVTDDGTGVLIGSDSGAVNFSGGITASTGAHPAFTATGGGTVTVTGSANTLTTTTGTALDVETTQIGTTGLTFQSISAGTATTGPTEGIILNSTGTGPLSVTGTGGAGTGGTIQKATSVAADPVGNRAAGAELINTGAVSLDDMNFNANAANGVWSNDAASLSVSNSSFTDNGLIGVHVGTSGTFSGTFDIASNTFSENNSAQGDDIAVILGVPTAGTGTVTGHITGNTIGATTADSGAAGGGDGIDLNDESNYTLTADVSNNTISQIHEGNGISAGVGGSEAGGTLNLTLNGNNVTMGQTDSIDAMTVVAGANTVTGSTNHVATVCLNAIGNTATAAGTAAANGQFDADGLSVIQNGTGAFSIFQIQGYTGGDTDANAVQNFLTSMASGNHLTGAGPTGTPAGAFIQNLNTTGFTNAPGTPASCPTAP